MRKYRRFVPAVGWLVALGGLGAQYMTTGFSYIGLLVSLVGVVILAYYFWDDIRKLRLVIAPSGEGETYTFPSGELLLTLAVIPVALVITGYVFYYSFPPTAAVTTIPPITQTNTNSPGGINATGDVTVNPEVNPNAAIVSYDFNGTKRTTRTAPYLGVDLNEDVPQVKAFQAMSKFESEQNWPELKRMCEEETEKTPDWLTPPLLCGKVYAVRGEIDKAIERIEYVQKKAAGRPDYAIANQFREEIQQQIGK